MQSCTRLSKKPGKSSGSAIWNVRLELGHQFEPTPLRTTQFAPPIPSILPHPAPPSGYAPPQVGLPWKADRFSGQDFPLQPDGTLRCPADQSLVAHEQRREVDGSLRVVYAGSHRSCRPWPDATSSVNGRGAPPRSRVRSVCCCIHWSLGLNPFSGVTGTVGTTDGRASSWCAINASRSRSNRPPRLASRSRLRPFPGQSAAHSRLSWAQRLARNARPLTAGRVTIKLFGVPQAFASWLGLTVG